MRLETGYGLGMGLWTIGPLLDISYWIFLRSLFKFSLDFFSFSRTPILQSGCTLPTSPFIPHLPTFVPPLMSVLCLCLSKIIIFPFPYEGFRQTRPDQTTTPT